MRTKKPHMRKPQAAKGNPSIKAAKAGAFKQARRLARGKPLKY